MPPLLQPLPLLQLSVEAAAGMVLAQALTSPHTMQGGKIHHLTHQFLPPMLLQDVLSCVLRQLAIHHPIHVSPSIISCLLHVLSHPNMTKCDLSDLSYAGAVELEVLDEVESTLVQLLPSLSHLTHLKLSTQCKTVSLPSCSSEVLEVVGRCCPNLIHLNVNYNNRVTSEGLLHLYPGEERPGCLKLEELFIKSCAVDPMDVAVFLYSFPALRLVGFRELGASLEIISQRPRWFGGTKKRRQRCTLQLTHLDNTMSRSQRYDGEMVDFLVKSCPNLENLKIRVRDKDVAQLDKLRQLKHLELRYYTGVHHPMGNTTAQYLTGPGSAGLVSLTIFCDLLHARHVATIAHSCHNLLKLYLYANSAVADAPLIPAENKMQKLEVLSLRLGNDELVMSPTACDLLLFLVMNVTHLKELFILLRSQQLTHDFMVNLLVKNPLPSLTVFIADAPRRTLVAPMLEFSMETAYLIINTCPELRLLGNLVCWNVSKEEVVVLEAMKRLHNYNLKIICKHSNKINS